MQEPSSEQTLSLAEAYGSELYAVGRGSTRTSDTVEPRLLGTIEEVLFHPQTAQAICVSVKPVPNIFSTLRALASSTPQRRYVRLGAFEPTTNDDGMLAFAAEPAVMRGKAQRAEAGVDLSWDDTVVFYKMPLVTVSGELLGKVGDAHFMWPGGRLIALEATSGATADVSLGKRRIPARFVRHFRLGANENELHSIVVADEAWECVHPGGLAAHAGVVAGKLEKTARRAQAAVGTASAKMTRKVSKSVAKTLKGNTAVEKAGRRAKGLWATFAAGYQEGLHSDEDSK
jgi:uncharacterized protein YrrD